MKYMILLAAFVINIKGYSQIQINYNANQGEIESFYYKDNTVLFNISKYGKLNFIELDNPKSDTVMQLLFTANNTDIYAEQLYEINYSDDYYKSELEKSLPTSINGHRIEYYTDYYDDEVLKGKIKRIDNIRITYFSDYYLPEYIKGSVKSIGSLTVSYYDAYYNEDNIGKLKKIGSITISRIDGYTKDYLKGKISKIGNLKLDYFDDYYNDEHNGEFKKIIGHDSRFFLNML